MIENPWKEPEAKSLHGKQVAHAKELVVDDHLIGFINGVSQLAKLHLPAA